MSKRASATPYARALFDVARAENRLDTTAAALAAVAGLFDDHPELARVLTHPAVAPRAKHELMQRLLSELGITGPEQKLLLLLADRDRLALVRDVQRGFETRVLQHRRIVQAHVTTAVPLPPDRADALATGLQRASGKQVRLTTSVDPSIMGGVVAQLGSTVYDGSIRRQLERVREQIVSQG
jgi:F-type H+-transporting ATPase subunit delta